MKPKTLEFETEVKFAEKKSFKQRLVEFFTFAKLRRSIKEFNWKRWAKKNLNFYGLGRFLWIVARTLLLIGLCYVVLQPLIIKFAVSFMSTNDLTDSTVMFIPREGSTYFIQRAIYSMNYWSALGNTALLSLGVAILQLLVASLVGYGFARYKFRGRNLIFFLVILSLIIPAQTTLLPYYNTFQGIGLVNTIIPVLIITLFGLGLKAGLYIYLMRQFFRGMPKSLEEAAYIDGCGPIKTFFVVMLPNAFNMMITVFLFAFTWQWTDTTYNSMLMPNMTLFSNMITKVAGALDDDIQSSALLDTSSLLVVLPVLIVFLVLQRYFVQGIERSGLVE